MFSFGGHTKKELYFIFKDTVYHLITFVMIVFNQLCNALKCFYKINDYDCINVIL